MPPNWESLYVQLGHLIQMTPMLNAAQFTPELRMWLGRAGALIEEIDDAADVANMRAATAGLQDILSRYRCAHEIQSILYRSLATAELRSPAAAQGAFIPAGSAFDAYAAVGKVLSPVTADALIVDPYMDRESPDRIRTARTGGSIHPATRG